MSLYKSFFFFLNSGLKTQIQCGRECVEFDQMCDGNMDCVNAADEEGCPGKQPGHSIT